MKPYADQPNNKPIFNEFITSIGTLVHCYHDKPSLQTHEKTKAPILDENGIQKADFKVTLMWPKAELETSLIPLRTLAATTRDQAWPTAATDSWFRLETFLRDGDNPEHNTQRKDYLMGHTYLNFKQAASAVRHADGRVVYSGAPQLVGPYNEDLLPIDIFPGVKARVSGVMFGTEYSGKNFISVRLNNIQKAPEDPMQPFVRIGGGGRPDAKKQFDPLSSGMAPGGAPGLRNIVL